MEEGSLHSSHDTIPLVANRFCTPYMSEKDPPGQPKVGAKSLGFRGTVMTGRSVSGSRIGDVTAPSLSFEQQFPF